MLFNFYYLTMIIAFSLMYAASTFVGVSVGKQNLYEAKLYATCILALCLIVQVALGAAVILYSEKIISNYTTNNEVAEIEVDAIKYSTLFAVFNGLSVTTEGIIKGIGQ